MKLFRPLLVLAAAAQLAGAIAGAEPLPARLQGSWRIVRVLHTSNTACWGDTQAQPLVGSRLSYSANQMRWQGGSVALSDITTRNLTAAQFSRENGGAEGAATFTQLGISSPRVLEVDLQHEDMDITGATTEVPGDSVLLAGPNRIIVSACGVFFEAVRASGATRTSLQR